MVLKMIKRLKSIFSRQGENRIVFWSDHVTDFQPPMPAASAIPGWWKKMPSYGGFKNTEANKKVMNIRNASDNATIKRCIPVLDSMSMGYLVVTPAELYVKPKDVTEKNVKDGPTSEFFMFYPRHAEKVDYHPWGQASKHPYATKQRLAKVFTPWHVRLPDGYSLIITEPLNNPSPYWSVVSGVMDSDAFYPTLNFMVAIKDPNFEGIIPAGTPIAQLIPFKRDNWSSVIVDNDQNSGTIIKDNQVVLSSRLSKVFHGSYKKLFWSKKDFR